MAEEFPHHLSLLVLVITMTTAYRHQLGYTGKMMIIPARVEVSTTEKKRFSDVQIIINLARCCLQWAKRELNHLKGAL